MTFREFVSARKSSGIATLMRQESACEKDFLARVIKLKLEEGQDFTSESELLEWCRYHKAKPHTLTVAKSLWKQYRKSRVCLKSKEARLLRTL